MISRRFAHELAALGRLDEASPEAWLDRVTTLATRGIPGCAAADAAIWRGDQVLRSAASHPDVGVLAEIQRTAQGPAWEAHHAGEPVYVPDTAAEPRWTRYAAEALRRGVRASLTLPLGASGANGMAMSLGLYAVRPHTFGQLSAEPLATLLTEQIPVALGNSMQYATATREARQMRQAVSSRAVVDQAKGVIMRAYGCDADTAFAKLREISQHSHVKLTDMASRLIDEHDAALGAIRQ